MDKEIVTNPRSLMPLSRCCLVPFSSQFVPHLKALKQEQMEQILDRFDAREEVYESHVIVNQGDTVGTGGGGGGSSTCGAGDDSSLSRQEVYESRVIVNQAGLLRKLHHHQGEWGMDGWMDGGCGVLPLLYPLCV